MNAPKQTLDELRATLLDLHKALVDAEKISYEKTIGTIPSPHHFLKLLMDDPWFAWLHPLSQLIVAMDEALEEKDGPVTDATLNTLMQQARSMLVASEEGDGFSKHYYDALQEDPDVVLTHGKAAKILNLHKSPG